MDVTMHKYVDTVQDKNVFKIVKKHGDVDYWFEGNDGSELAVVKDDDITNGVHLRWTRDGDNSDWWYNTQALRELATFLNAVADDIDNTK